VKALAAGILVSLIFLDFQNSSGHTLQERLDSLGLEENPPTSDEISRRIGVAAEACPR